MRVSVIVPTYRRPNLLAKCLKQLAPEVQNLPPSAYEVIVSDDGRSDETRAVVAACGYAVRLVDGPSRGPAANRNVAASFATGPFLAFTDDDCEPSAGWLSAILGVAESASVDVIEGRTIADRRRRSRSELSPINEVGGVLWSCNFAISREFFSRIGGFDERFPYASFEDVDLYYRCLQQGARIKFVSEAVVVHPWRVSKSWEYHRRHLHSTVIFMDKYPEEGAFYSARHWLGMLKFTLLSDLPTTIIFYKCHGLLNIIYQLAAQIFLLYLVCFGRRPFLRYNASWLIPRVGKPT